MRRISSDQILKAASLYAQFVANGLLVVGIERALVFAPDVPVESDRERRMLAAQGDGLLDRVPCHHQARARHDAVRMGVDDASVDACGSAAIIGIED